jgi:hypothetical protein
VSSTRGSSAVLRKRAPNLVDRVFVNSASLHDHHEVLGGIFDRFDIRHWVAIGFCPSPGKDFLNTLDELKNQ